MTAQIGWNFPLNNDGDEEGFNDAGIETFRGDALQHLARETIQNSLDAADASTSDPVVVRYRLIHLPAHEFPGRQQFERALEQCRDYWRDNAKAYRFLKHSLAILRQGEIPFLKISDYNTTGLTGATKKNARDSNWHSLVKSSGVSNKDPGSGGSFGIGKNAPFACSNLRCLFYGTHDQDGVTAFQGVTKLATHPNDDNQLTRRTGYWGIVDKNQPTLDLEAVPALFHRSEIGTDLFVAGFHDREGWTKDIIVSVIDNFLVAVHEGRLIVEVQGVTIDSTSLPGLIEVYAEPDGLAAGYYNSLTSGDAKHFHEPNFEGLGPVDLFIHVDRYYQQRRVAMVRKTGMKIFDKGHIPVPLRLAGVMIAHGEAINELLRSMEPPAHNKWEPERHAENPRRARLVRDKLYRWVNEQARSVMSSEGQKELEIQGIGQFLPDDIDDISSEMPEEYAGLQGLARPVVIEAASSPRSTPSGPDLPGGPGLPDPDDPEPTPPGPTPPSPTPPKPGPSEPSGSSQGKAVALRNKRIFCVNPDRGEYVVNFTPEFDGDGTMSVFIQGEVDSHRARVANAVDQTTGRRLPVNSDTGAVGPIQLNPQIRSRIVVRLAEPLRLALEVVVRENQR